MRTGEESRLIIEKCGKIDYMYGIPLFGSSMGLLLKMVESGELKKPVWIATVNPEFVMATWKDGEFLKMLQERTSVNVVDGVGLAWANEVQLRITNDELRIIKIVKRIFFGAIEGVKVLGGGYKNKIISGVDLVDELCALAEKTNKTVFFYGGWDDRSERTAKYFLKKYPKLKVVGAQAEDFNFEIKVDFLFVCRAMKKQEEWINEHLHELKVGVVIGLGRTFDYYSGELPRAPRWVRGMGLEWLYSFFTDKGRRKRKLDLPKFVLKTLFQG
ncbi:WecB/TagA/CpsF family glycosyltransferase [Candidatus Shapirobacteria bacterium]|nr:WecB/TagA/CpsF family glycosyltransferase [Candidatus Shapirobacteria bacterium]